MGDFSLAEALVNFASGSEVNWNNFNLAIPPEVIIYTTDTKKFKRGDGVHRYVDLPEAASITGIASGTGSLVNVLVELVAGDNDKIIIIDNEMYKPSATQLTDVVNRISAITSMDIVQTANMDTITNQFYMVDTNINGADDGKLVITTNHKMTSGPLPENLATVVPPSPTHMLKHDIYDSIQCNRVPVWLYSGHTYYYSIEGSHDSVDTDSLSFGLTSDAGTDVTITQVERGLFKIVVGSVQYNKPIAFTPSVTYNTDSVSKSRGIVILGYDGSGWAGGLSLISCVYGGTVADLFYGVAIDSNNDIICAGNTYSEGTGSPTYLNALVVKFDSNLNILARKIYGGVNNDEFWGVAIDSNNNIICAGNTYSEGTGSPTYTNALVVKFDSNLTILARKIYSGANHDLFIAVAIDSNDNIICAGNTYSEGTGSPTYLNALVVKFDSNLNILARKTYSGASSDEFWGVAIDSNNNIICAGYTISEGPGGVNALVVKFDSNLNILARKIYHGAGDDNFRSVAIDSSDNIIGVGYTNSEGPGGVNALVVKFDINLNILAHKIYGGTNNDEFRSVATDSNNNIICVGYTFSEGTGDIDALVVKFDSNLTILARKIYMGGGNVGFGSVAIDSSNNIICAGHTYSEGMGDREALVLKLPMDIPSGTFVGTTLTGLSLSDSNLTLADSTLTLADSTLTLANSGLTLADSTLTLAASTLTQEIEDFGTGGFIFKDILASVYGGANSDLFHGVAIDSNNNIICAGHTKSEGTGSTTYYNALVVKFDSNLNILARKIYGGAYHDVFHAVAIDSNNNIICVGYTYSEGVGSTTYSNALVVKFDSNLTILARKSYSGANYDLFQAVAIDSNNSIICAGWTYSEGTGSTTYYNALVVKFDSNLTILARKIYGGANHDEFRSVAIDSNNNIICAGYTRSEGVGSPTYWNALVVKFDSNLTILARKSYGGADHDVFYGVAIDSNNNIICAGYTYSEGVGSTTCMNALVVKFDSNLTILARKTYGGTKDDGLATVAIDSNDNIICAGNTLSEGIGAPTYYNAFVVKFDSNLTILARKLYSGGYSEEFRSVAIDSSNNIICAGYTDSEGLGSNEALVLKLPMDIPSGTFVGTTLTGLTLSDSNLTLAESGLTLAESGLTLAESGLTLAESGLTLDDSGLTQEIDTINP